MTPDATGLREGLAQVRQTVQTWPAWKRTTKERPMDATGLRECDARQRACVNDGEVVHGKWICREHLKDYAALAARLSAKELEGEAMRVVTEMYSSQQADDLKRRDDLTIERDALAARLKQAEPTCLVCGKSEPCMTAADKPCTFDPTPQQLFIENTRLKAALAEWLKFAEVHGGIPRIYVERTKAALTAPPEASASPSTDSCTPDSGSADAGPAATTDGGSDDR